MNVNNLVLATEHLAGLAVVLFALTCLWALTALMGWLVARFNRPAVVPTQEFAAPAAGATDSTDDDEAAVIAATVMMLLGSKARVVEVHPLPSSWADHGRRDIHVSHRFR